MDQLLTGPIVHQLKLRPRKVKAQEHLRPRASETKDLNPSTRSQFETSESKTSKSETSEIAESETSKFKTFETSESEAFETLEFRDQ